jgi:hypothetical protein
MDVRDFQRPNLGCYGLSEFIASFVNWSEPIIVDNDLSYINTRWDVHEENEAALRPRIQDISNI